jgi:ribosomal protein L7/L12
MAGLQAAAVPDLQLNDVAASAVVSALLQGNKIAAIKAYREAAGAGLKQAKVAVEALERQLHDQGLENLAGHRDPLDATIAPLQVPGRPDGLPAAAVVDPQLDDIAASAVISVLRRGDKIAAIKAYRKATGAGLKQAKAAVEAIEQRLVP